VGHTRCIRLIAAGQSSITAGAHGSWCCDTPVPRHVELVCVPQKGLQAEFMEWTAAEQAAGNITFAVKLASGSDTAVTDGQSGAGMLRRRVGTVMQHAAALL